MVAPKMIVRSLLCGGEYFSFDADAGRGVQEAQEYSGQVYQLDDLYRRDCSAFKKGTG